MYGILIISGGIIVQIFFMLTVMNSPRKKVFNVIGFVTVGCHL